MLLPGSALVAAESILALTPVVVKLTHLDPISALWSRILTGAILGYLLTGDRSLPPSEYAGSTALGYTNLLHIASSYESFRNLPAGQAMSLLYTYPMWNLVFGAYFNGEAIAARDYGFMGLAAVGSTLLNMDPGHTVESGIGRKPQPVWGILMALLSAITESGMHTLLRRMNWKDAAKSVWVVNGSASLWLTVFLGLQQLLFGSGGMDIKQTVTGTWSDAFLMTAFHGFVMFSGYWLRFFAVPRLSTVTYSILSYTGLLASYLFGMWFLGERPGWMSLIGAALILVSGLFLQMSAPKSDESTGSDHRRSGDKDA